MTGEELAYALMEKGEVSLSAPIEDVRTFADMGIMTSNDGIVVTLRDGTEYQLTIQQTR